MNRKNIVFAVAMFLVALLLASCGSNASNESTSVFSTEREETSTTSEGSSSLLSTEYTSTTLSQQSETAVQTTLDEQEIIETEKPKEMKMKIKIDNTALDVEWERNEATAKLFELCKDAPIKIKMSMYGGFEQVGPLGENLPRNDRQMTTESGDIVLYSGNQIVIFYGSNAWAYTKLGKIIGQDRGNMTTLLSRGNVTLTIYAE